MCLQCRSVGLSKHPPAHLPRPPGRMPASSARPPARLLVVQMVSKAHIRAAEETEKLRAMELAQQAEANYMGKIKQTLDASQPTVWHGYKKVEWYH